MIKSASLRNLDHCKRFSQIYDKKSFYDDQSVHKLLDIVQDDAVESLVEHYAWLTEDTQVNVRLVSDNSLEKSVETVVSLQGWRQTVFHSAGLKTAKLPG